MKYYSIPLMLTLAYIVIAFYAWQARNPKANQMTFYTHFEDVVKFKKLEKFQ